MAKRTKKSNKSLLKLEALEQRQLLAGGFTADQGQEFSNIKHANGNVYDQVLLKSSSITVTNDAGQITRVSFLDGNGDIVQAEFSGAGSLSISLDPESYKGPAEATNYVQPGIQYVSGLASFTIQGSDATTNFTIYSVGRGTNSVNQALFDGTHNGGDHLADVQRVTVVADPANPNGSLFGGIRAGNALFSASSGVVGITASNVQVQNTMIVGDINAKGSATPSLVFGANSQFGDVRIAGGDLVQDNGKSINNTGSYAFGLSLEDGTKSDGTLVTKASSTASTSWTAGNPGSANNKSLVLTTATDTLTGGSGDDTFTASDGTLTAFDKLTGGAGTDTLNVSNITGTVTNGNAVTVSGIENLSIQNGLGAITTDVGAWTDLKTVTIAETVAQNVTLTTNSNVTNVSVRSTAGGAFSVTDGANDAGDKLTTVSLDGYSAASSISSNALTDVTLANASLNVSITGGSSARNLNLNNVDGGAIADNKATSLSITVGGGDKSTGASLSATKATTVSFAGGKELSLTGATLDEATSLVFTGTAKATLQTLAAAKLTSVDASGSTGGVVIGSVDAAAGATTSISNDASFTGGTGGDTVAIKSTNKAIATGAGNDTVIVNADTLGSGSVDAGEGTDTLSMDSSFASSVSNTFFSKLTGFERLKFSGAASVDISKFGNINYVDLSGSTVTLTKAVANTTVVMNGANAANTVTVGYADAGAGSDVLNLSVGGLNSGSGSKDLGTLAVTGNNIETVNITTADNNSNGATGDFREILALSDSGASTVNISGNAGIDFSVTGTGLKTLDASGITKGSLKFANGSALDQGATIKGTGAGDDISITANTSKGVTIQAGDGENTIVATAGTDNKVTTGKDADGITTGAGADTITAGDGNNTVIAGAGNNVITTGSGTDGITAGAGDDTIHAGGGNDTISSGAGLDLLYGEGGNDTFVITGGTATQYAAIMDVNVGDKIQFTANRGTETFTAAKVSSADTTPFTTLLNDATAGDGSATGIIRWFQFAGNTYVVYDASDEITFSAAEGDQVVKIAGLVDLANGPTGNGAAVPSNGVGGAPVLTIV